MKDEAVKKIRCLILHMVVVDFADSECEASAKLVTVCAKREQ